MGRWDDVAAGLPRPPVQARAKTTVETVLNAAEEAITRYGIERFTTEHVARLAGVSIGTIYNYFDDRVAILDAIRPHRFDAEKILQEIGEQLHDFRTRTAGELSQENQDILDDLIILTQPSSGATQDAPG